MIFDVNFYVENITIEVQRGRIRQYQITPFLETNIYFI